ncbi:MAG: hypothetical protein HFH91_13725 [Lachnospiraceae bacterium]|nr:hypothetical protein [Lachnospiraceae bacterium]
MRLEMADVFQVTAGNTVITELERMEVQVLIVPEKPLITVEGMGTPYANTKNYCMDNRESIKAIVQVDKIT